MISAFKASYSAILIAGAVQTGSGVLCKQAVGCWQRVKAHVLFTGAVAPTIQQTPQTANLAPRTNCFCSKTPLETSIMMMMWNSFGVAMCVPWRADVRMLIPRMMWLVVLLPSSWHLHWVHAMTGSHSQHKSCYKRFNRLSPCPHCTHNQFAGQLARRTIALWQLFSTSRNPNARPQGSH
jgi:hypothetical protein